MAIQAASHLDSSPVITRALFVRVLEQMKTSAGGPENSGIESGGVTRTQGVESDGEETIPLYKAAMWLMDEVS